MSELDTLEELAESPQPSWRRRLKLFAPLVLVIAIAAAWYFGDLGRLNSPEKVANAARALRDSPWALVYVLAAFSLGSLLFFPITALIAGTVLAFDALHGFFYAYAGALFAAMLTYWVGRLLGSEILKYVRGPKIARFQHELKTHAFRASIAARFVPVGSFALLNMMAGSLHVPFRWYVLGNLVGLLPGLLIMTFFADQLASAVWSSDSKRLLIIGGCLIASGVGWYLWRRRVRRKRIPSTQESMAE